MLATQSPRLPLATETGERCFTGLIDQLSLTGTLLLLTMTMNQICVAGKLYYLLRYKDYFNPFHTFSHTVCHRTGLCEGKQCD